MSAVISLGRADQELEAFIQNFYDLLPKINPKELRLFCYDLYSKGITLDQLKTPKINLLQIPLENLIIIMKYGYPYLIEGDFFFYHLIDQLEDWLDFYYQLAEFKGIDLNHLNKSDGKGLIHYFIEKGNLSQLELLLSYRVNPNLPNAKKESPLYIAISKLSTASEENKWIQLQIIRALVRYGARVQEEDLQLISKIQLRDKTVQERISQEILTGTNLKPYYSPIQDFYIFLDQLEDLSILVKENPEILFNEAYQKTLLELGIQSVGSSDHEKLYNSLYKRVKEFQEDYLKTPDGILGWPYYINSGIDWKNLKLSLKKPVGLEFRVASPPPHEEVLEKALEQLTE